VEVRQHVAPFVQPARDRIKLAAQPGTFVRLAALVTAQARSLRLSSNPRRAEMRALRASLSASRSSRVLDAPLRSQRLIKRVIQFFPGIRSADRREQKRIGLGVLTKALGDPTLQMEIRRQVTLPDD
jgi:hypothetical protein